MSRIWAELKSENQLSKKAKFDHILFLDCDVELVADDFVSTYLKNLSHQVVCGSRIYPEKVDEEYRLHKVYGEKREHRSLGKREQEPWSHFMTSNFLIRKMLISKIGFDETISGYGHEDTLLGWQLENAGIEVKHIENQVVHIGLDVTDAFIGKSLKGAQNGYELYADGKIPLTKIRAVATFNQIKKMRIDRLLHWLLGFMSTPFRKNLKGSNPQLIFLDLLKLQAIYRLLAKRDS